MQGDFESGTELGIAVLVPRSLSLLKSLTLALEDDHTQASQVRLCLSRFKLWVGNLGENHGSGVRSLELKLRYASHIRKLVISLLSDLCSSIERGLQLANQGHGLDTAGYSYDQVEKDLADYFNDEDSDKSEGAKTLDEIAHVVSCLLRLSPTISNLPHYSQCLSQANDSLFESYVDWDTQYVRVSFPKVSQGLADRLGRAMARRRLYFEYRKAHANRLSQGLGEGEIENKQATTLVLSAPFKEPGETRSSPTGLAGDGSSTSAPSYATSKHDPTKLRVPHIPKEHMNRLFMCPFCHMAMSVFTRRAWKKHVFGDLRPYVCVSDICKTSEHIYMHRSEWVMHMRREHWKSWQCPFGCNVEFDNAERFQQHVEESHQHGMHPDIINAWVNSNGFRNAAKAKGQCPLCFDFQISSEEQYEKHIGQHLRDLALFTLPDTGDKGNRGNLGNQTDAGDEKSDDEVEDEGNDNISGTDKLEAEVLAAWEKWERDLEASREAEEARKAFEQRVEASKLLVREGKTNLGPGEDDVKMDDFEAAALAAASIEPTSSDLKPRRPLEWTTKSSFARLFSAHKVTRNRSKRNKALQGSMDSQPKAEHKTKEKEPQDKHPQELPLEEAVEQAQIDSEVSMKAAEDWRKAEASSHNQVVEDYRRDSNTAANIAQRKSESEVRNKGSVESKDDDSWDY